MRLRLGPPAREVHVGARGMRLELAVKEWETDCRLGVRSLGVEEPAAGARLLTSLPHGPREDLVSLRYVGPWRLAPTYRGIDNELAVRSRAATRAQA